MTKILVIDDNVSIADTLKVYFTMKGNHCDIAYDAKTGINLALENNYDILLLDLAMPEYDGMWVLHHLEKTDKLKDFKIFIFSASSTESNINEIKNLGVTGFIKKPIPLERLYTIISS